MARLQILELPEGSGDDRPPFVLVVDQYEPQRYILGADQPEPVDQFEGIAEQIGARAVLVFEDTIDIPANDTTAYLNAGDSRPELVVELAGRDIDGAIDAAIRKVKDGPRLARERTEIARDMDRLANHKAAITDALGIDRLRDWDDIRNAAAGLKRERDTHAAAIERVRRTPTKPEIMNAQQENPTVWMHGYECGVLAAKSDLRPHNEPTSKPTDA
ncbi:hypothetical protein [Streptomyces swartbergensis]|uniref:Uncharacterized protein n=1 Tax=Streptomyces swartbergensis TaxID=487165 RepID=A0A243SAI8_9ACTN|nr:hypothetical protein [Streptomyces swartbergensis]OUD04687.1 hypothetical protein CA983_02725 [Streptomyces swartbergensis]